MELIWLMLALLVVDLAAFRFGADTRPGLQHTPRTWVPRPGALKAAAPRSSSIATRRSISG
jgi:hypothetical protein